MVILSISLILLLQICVAASQQCKIKERTPWAITNHVHSTRRKIEVTLNVRVATITHDWLRVQRRTYNGHIPGPTIRVKKGDELIINLVNQLADVESHKKLNEHRYQDSTNLHLHGLHIDSRVPGDNVLIRIKPGQRYTYSYKIEEDQPAGTYWFHPHLHGSTILQVNSGMAGMLIVEDDQFTSDALKATSCPWNCKNDYSLMFQPTLLYLNNTASSEDPFVTIQNLYPDHLTWSGTSKAGCNPTSDWLKIRSGLNNFTTNGKLNPVITFASGSKKRFRMVNAGGSAILEMEMVNAVTQNHDCEYVEIALDGVYLDNPRTPRQHKTLLVPGGRADWIVLCAKPGTYLVRSRALWIDSNSTGESTRRYNGTLFTLRVTGVARNAVIGKVPLPARPHYVNFPTRNDLKTSFSIEIGPQLTLNREHFAGEHYIRHQTKVNELVQWNFLNTMPKEGHPMHIHVNHFKIVSYEPYTGPIGQTVLNSGKPFSKQPWLMFSQDGSVCYHQHAAYDENHKFEKLAPGTVTSYPHHEIWDKDVAGTVGYSQSGDYRDTLMVPPLSNITIQFMVHKFTDIVVIHCHFLRHEDLGMMLLVDIVDPDEGEKVCVMAKSGNALPGQCNKVKEAATKNKTAQTKPKNGTFTLCILLFLAHFNL